MKNSILSLLAILIIFNSHASTNSTQYAAGILPFVTTQEGVSYILLGKENPDDGYSSKDTYSDFGGTRDTGETTIQAALREFKEETGLLKTNDWAEINDYINEARLKEASYSKIAFPNRLTYQMYLLPIPYEIITDERFKKALQNRDGEKSTIALFPLIPFLNRIKDFETDSHKTNYVYYERENLTENKTTGYFLRKSFIKSFTQLSKTSNLIKNAEQNQNIGKNAKIEIISNGIDNKKSFFTVTFFSIAGILFLCLLVYKYPFLNQFKKPVNIICHWHLEFI